MSRTWSISAQHPYGLARVCTAWGVSRATVHRHRQAANSPRAPRRRPGPEGAMSDADLAVRIRALLADSPFHGAYSTRIWPPIPRGLGHPFHEHLATCSTALGHPWIGGL